MKRYALFSIFRNSFGSSLSLVLPPQIQPSSSPPPNLAYLHASILLYNSIQDSSGFILASLLTPEEGLLQKRSSHIDMSPHRIRVKTKDSLENVFPFFHPQNRFAIHILSNHRQFSDTGRGVQNAPPTHAHDRSKMIQGQGARGVVPTLVRSIRARCWDLRLPLFGGERDGDVTGEEWCAARPMAAALDGMVRVW